MTLPRSSPLVALLALLGAFTAFAAAVALPSAQARQPREDSLARAIIERAIVAHGGRERLMRGRADRVKLKGSLQVGPAVVPFVNELTVQLPGRFKSVCLLADGHTTRTLVHVLDGGNARILLDGKEQPVGAIHLAQLRQTLQLEEAMRLVPLLSDPEFAIQALPEVRYNDRVYVAVQVAGKGQRGLKLFFDRGSGLLVKSEYLLDGGPGAKEVLQEGFYGDYRDVAGLRRPGKIVVLRDGKKVMEAELIEAQRFDRIDPSEFAR